MAGQTNNGMTTKVLVSQQRNEILGVMRVVHGECKAMVAGSLRLTNKLKGNTCMFDQEEFISAFVEAAKANNEEAMKLLAERVSVESAELRVELLEGLVDEMAKTEANKEVEAGLNATLQLMRLAVEHQDSTGVVAKDTSKAVEATQDVAADTSADEVTGDSEEAKAVAEDETVAESEGKAPAEEVKAEKTEQ